jgi:hypothetical protein
MSGDDLRQPGPEELHSEEREGCERAQRYMG